MHADISILIPTKEYPEERRLLLEGQPPSRDGFSELARTTIDIIESGGSHHHPMKKGLSRLFDQQPSSTRQNDNRPVTHLQHSRCVPTTTLSPARRSTLERCVSYCWIDFAAPRKPFERSD